MRNVAGRTGISSRLLERPQPENAHCTRAGRETSAAAWANRLVESLVDRECWTVVARSRGMHAKDARRRARRNIHLNLGVRLRHERDGHSVEVYPAIALGVHHVRPGDRHQRPGGPAGWRDAGHRDFRVDSERYAIAGRSAHSHDQIAGRRRRGYRHPDRRIAPRNLEIGGRRGKRPIEGGRLPSWLRSSGSGW